MPHDLGRKFVMPALPLAADASLAALPPVDSLHAATWECVVWQSNCMEFCNYVSQSGWLLKLIS